MRKHRGARRISRAEGTSLFCRGRGFFQINEPESRAYAFRFKCKISHALVESEILYAPVAGEQFAAQGGKEGFQMGQQTFAESFVPMRRMDHQLADAQSVPVRNAAHRTHDLPFRVHGLEKHRAVPELGVKLFQRFPQGGNGKVPQRLRFALESQVLQGQNGRQILGYGCLYIRYVSLLYRRAASGGGIRSGSLKNPWGSVKPFSRRCAGLRSMPSPRPLIPSAEPPIRRTTGAYMLHPGFRYKQRSASWKKSARARERPH